MAVNMLLFNRVIVGFARTYEILFSFRYFSLLLSLPFLCICSVAMLTDFFPIILSDCVVCTKQWL